MKKELREGIDTIHDKDRRIAEAKNKIVELEKFKYVLQYKIGELQGQEEPRQQKLAALQAQIKARLLKQPPSDQLCWCRRMQLP